MTTDDRAAGLGWPTGTTPDLTGESTADPSTTAGLGWPTEAAPGVPGRDDVTHDRELA